ncbi:MAG: OstA-like protein, partial [Candidatus Cryptobacteroides sp.]
MNLNRLFSRFLLPAVLFCSVGLSVSAQQEDRDSLVVLISAKSAQAVVRDGDSFRKVTGPARFFHNNTYLLCDTAFWNVDNNYIDAIGNVQIIQDETILTGDKLTYLIDKDLAQFRGSVVQLLDKDDNTLRTGNLDYNTKDSVAVFRDGGSMRDKDGQIIESMEGTYDSRIKLFSFRDNVNMFSDTIFVKTSSLDYDSETSFATFGKGTDMWNKENMLSSDAGWYDRSREIFLFNRDVHLMTDTQEAWCDSVYYYRAVNDVTMLGNVQVIDTTKNISAVAGRMDYCDSLSRLKMRRKPAFIAATTSAEGVQDTVYVAAGQIDYWTKMMFRVDSAEVAVARERVKSLDTDPVGTYRRKAAAEAAKAADEAARENDANYAAKKNAEAIRAARKDGAKKESLPVQKDSLSQRADPAVTRKDSLAARTDSLSVHTDSLAAQREPLPSRTDSLAVSSDSLTVKADTVVQPPAVDSTKIGFLTALKNVRMYRSDARIVCDSLDYCDLDSLARLYREPIVWQEGTRQYAADSIYVVVRNNSMDRASLMSNAFITIQEDREHFDQIKSAEMMAYFDAQGQLSRFDALGGVQAMFFIKEEDVLATVNKADSKMLTAVFKNGEIQRVFYFDSAKNDGYPLVQMKKDERFLKGFNWQPERCPKDRYDVTDAGYRNPEREIFRLKPRARFPHTNKYFPGYMKKIYGEISFRDSLARVRAEQQRILNEKRLAADPLATVADTLSAVPDTSAA